MARRYWIMVSYGLFGSFFAMGYSTSELFHELHTSRMFRLDAGYCHFHALALHHLVYNWSFRSAGMLTLGDKNRKPKHVSAVSTLVKRL